MFITSVLQFLDKTALNYANLFGIRPDLHLSGNQYSWLASIFYLGYLVGQFPASYLFTRFSTGRILGVCTIFWGVTVLALHGARVLLVQLLVGSCWEYSRHPSRLV